MYSSLVYIIVISLVNAVEIKVKNVDKGYASTYNNFEPTSYSYSYGVDDPQTGDRKSQWETRENGVVRGSYSLLEPDGTTRLVEYTADETGFHPVVKRLGIPSAANTGDIAARNYYNSDYNPNPYNLNRPAYSDNLDYRYNRRGNGEYFNGRYSNYRSSSRYDSSPYYPESYYNSYQRSSYNGRSFNQFIPDGTSTPYHLPLRQQTQPVPLLHSAYHGYNNLYN